MSDKNSGQDEVGSLIGSRTLHRKTKEVLDRLEEVGEPVVILRYGRPAAALMPIDEDQAKKLLLAASVRERRAAEAVDEPSPGRLFAVSAREVESEEPEDVPVQEQLVETSHLLETAAGDLMVELGRLAEVARSERVVDALEVNTSLVAIQERQTRWFARLAESIQEQAAMLNGIATLHADLGLTRTDIPSAHSEDG